ncbi:hypothetical protein DXG01_001681 [Tephrocybe rancida]|nr:hypothetical protein DXG01_001681 [Tephrocybe rancida]
MDDMLLIFSMDGAQLYQDKQSDCWIYIWVIGDLSPELCYKKRKVIPGGFIPEPNNPKHPESFVYPGIHHLAAIQKEGLCIWDAETKRIFVSHPFFHLGAADGPGSVHFTGLVGHHGAYPCRLYCSMKGRHKPGGSHYYPALLKPHNYHVAGCDHNDIHPGDIADGSSKEYEQNLIYLLNSCNTTNYKERRKDTGISTISIFHGLPEKHWLPLPLGFPGDVMHVLNLNLGDLLLDLCYRAKEWQGYFYGLGPALLHSILPLEIWHNFCKLVQVVQIVYQQRITLGQLQHAQTLIEEFLHEFELLYVQQWEDHIHMMCPCLHAIGHLPKETARLGPAPLYSTWTMERMIGDLGRDPLHQCSSQDIGNGYVLLCAKEEYGKVLTGTHGAVVRAYIIEHEAELGRAPPPRWLEPKVKKWAGFTSQMGKLLALHGRRRIAQQRESDVLVVLSST